MCNDWSFLVGNPSFILLVLLYDARNTDRRHSQHTHQQVTTQVTTLTKEATTQWKKSRPNDVESLGRGFVVIVRWLACDFLLPQ